MANMVKIEELAMIVGVSTKTIRNWYKFKRECPENEYAKILPEPIIFGKGPALHWNREDVWKVIEFKQNIIMGRNGIMGEITQKYATK